MRERERERDGVGSHLEQLSIVNDALVRELSLKLAHFDHELEIGGLVPHEHGPEYDCKIGTRHLVDFLLLVDLQRHRGVDRECQICIKQQAPRQYEATYLHQQVEDLAKHESASGRQHSDDSNQARDLLLVALSL